MFLDENQVLLVVYILLKGCWTMASRVLWRPLTGGVVWTSAGVAMGLVAPPALQGVIFAPQIIAAACWGGTALVLLPLGMMRGVITSVQEICQVHGRPALQQALDAAPSSQYLTTREGNQQLIERLTLGSGWQGRLVRTLASPFLPSTSQMMIRLQELADKQDKTTLDSQVIVTAVDGFVEGFLQDKKDTITMLGILGYAVIVAAGVGLDQIYRKMKSSQEPSQENNAPPEILDYTDFQKRLGLPPLTGKNEVDTHWKEQEKAKTTQKENVSSTTEKPFSIRESIDAAQIQLGEMTKWILRSKSQADPYLQQALNVVEAVKEEVEDHAASVFQQAKKMMLDEQNREQLQQQWKRLIDAIPVSSMDDQTLGKIAKDMEEVLRQTRKRLNDDDIQEMRRELQVVLDQAKERITQEKKRVMVDQMKEGLIAKIENWWNDRK